MYLLDTNVVSEPTRRQPSQKVLGWLAAIPPNALYLSVLSIGEIRKGVEKHANGRRKDDLRRWLESELRDWFGDRIVPISISVAERWGRLQAQTAHTLPVIDSLIAATALQHDLKLVTRNENDFQVPGLIIINPWRL